MSYCKIQFSTTKDLFKDDEELDSVQLVHTLNSIVSGIEEGKIKLKGLTRLFGEDESNLIGTLEFRDEVLHL